MMPCFMMPCFMTNRHSFTLIWRLPYPPGLRQDEDDVYLVMGKAVPEGVTTYVAMRTDPGSSMKDFLIINPCNGYIYSAGMMLCDMMHLYLT
jgi:hypothetical protein